MLVYLCLSRSQAHPSLGWPSRLSGQPLDFLGPYGPKKKFSDPYPLCGKRVRSAWESEPSDAILVGKDRDRGRISHDMTWWRIVAGSET